MRYGRYVHEVFEKNEGTIFLFQNHRTGDTVDHSKHSRAAESAKETLDVSRVKGSRLRYPQQLARYLSS